MARDQSVKPIDEKYSTRAKPFAPATARSRQCRGRVAGGDRECLARI